MSTWVGAIVETAGRADFWDVARKHGVDSITLEIPKYVLVECSVGFDFHASVRLAEARNTCSCVRCGNSRNSFRSDRTRTPRYDEETRC